MVNRKKMGKTGCLFLAAAMTASQIAVVSPVYAADQEYAGTTQISSSDVYPAVDTSAVELEIEEVCVEEGSRLAEGDAILKLTEESYQAACAYYEAAIIKADSTLTDTQLAYDQGVLEAKYTWESAEADAENAEYIRTYQTNEVENALTDHEEALEDIGDRITELEEGIADGSYDTSSAASSGGSASGSGSVSGSGNKMSGEADQQESEKESEFESKSETESENQSESESESETESENQSEAEISQSETEPASGENENSQPETEPASGENENSQPETEPASGETDDSKPDNGGTEDSEKTTEELRKELAMKMAEAEKQAQSLTEELKSLLEKTDTEEPDDTSYSVYTEQLKNIISQLESDIKGQEQVKDVLEAYDFTEKDSSCEALTETIEGDRRVLDSLKEIQEKMTKYQTLISSVMSMWGSGESTALVDTETLTQMSEYLSSQAEINELSVTLLEQYESEIKELEEKVSHSAQDSSSETESEKKTDVTPENADKTGSTDATGSMDQSGKPDTTGNTDQSGNPDTPSDSNGAGNIQSADQNGSAMSGTGASGGMSGATGGSAGSVSGAGAVSGTEQGSTVSAQGTTMSGQNGQSGLSDEEISLLGDTYDLSEVEQLLSREPSDSDDAQDLIDELEDSRETTQEQYEELQRKQKIFELEIQHTYDTAVIAGKLAELTYQQSLEEWEETLAEARQDKADLEAQKALLETMTDGAIYADQAGTVAAISYEAGDSLSSDTPVVSYYDTDTVSIILEVDQEDIADLSVGDTAEVTLTGAGQLEGTITEKSIEPESGTSRTSVKYTAIVSIDNTDGRLSDGMSATVTFSEDTKTDTESEETEANTEAAEQETETDEEAVVNE